MPMLSHQQEKLTKLNLSSIKQNAIDAVQFDRDEQEVSAAIVLFMESDVPGSEELLRGNCRESLLHCHGNGVVSMLKALMTFDQNDIKYSMDSLKNSIEASSNLRKETTYMASITGIFTGTAKGKTNLIKSMTAAEKMAEVVYAEGYLMRALLSILTEADFMTLIKEGLAIRQSFNIYKSCYRFLRKLHQKEGSEGLVKNGVSSSFITCVYLGMGAFNLMLSILPAKVIRIFEFIGFGGDRDFGMKCLALAAGWPADELVSPSRSTFSHGSVKKPVVDFFSESLPVEKDLGTRKFMCDLMLHLYHVLLSSMIQLPCTNIPLATIMIDAAIERHPDSFIYLMVRAKISQAERSLDRSLNELQRVITVQKGWRQLAHVCFWDMGISNAALGNYEKAAEYFEILYAENEWSKSIYLYFRAVLLYSADPIKNKQLVSELLHKIPSHLKKVAGKSVPLEKFVARKARKYFLQRERLLFPVLEIIYMWNGFDLIPDEQLKTTQKQLEVSLLDLDSQQEAGKKLDKEIPYETFYDDLCLVRFFKGLATRELSLPSSSMLIPEKKLIARILTPDQTSGMDYASKQLEFISLQADDIEYDHWILPFARYELATLHIRTGDYQRARAEYTAALNGGYNEDEAGKNKKKASMETSLHIRVHNALAKLDMLLLVKGELIPETKDLNTADQPKQAAESDSDEDA